MELYQLKTFKMVAEEGHLTRAAKRLHASQPAVSAHIKSLEEELKIRLFLRTPRGMELTTDGKKLKEYADKAISVTDDMVSYAENLRQTISGKLKIGIHSESEILRIPELFSLMNSLHPNIQIHLLQSMSGGLHGNLEDGALDIGFMYGVSDAENIFVTELQSLRLVIAGPVSWEDKLPQATPEELATFPWIMTPEDCPFNTVATRLFKRHKLSVTQVALADQETSIKSMIKSGLGVSLLLEDDINQESKEFAVWEKERLTLPLSLACLQRRREEPAIQALFGVLSSIWSPD